MKGKLKSREQGLSRRSQGEPLGNSAYDVIKTRILDKVVRPGEQLVETKLAEVPTVTRDEIIKSLSGAPKGEFTRTTETGKELTQEEKDGLKTDLEKNKSQETTAPTGFKSFYDMFTSNQA